ncbi:MAG: magnesium transporter [Deltaproteobacteria bacterium]|nr:magnesium transporter [Deltaproteobacteria bacterium]
MTRNHHEIDAGRVEAALAADDPKAVLRLIEERHPADIADAIEPLPETLKRRVFELLDPETAADVLVELNDPSREEILEETSPARLAEIAGEMESDDAADLIAELPRETAALVLRNMGREEMETVTELLRYPEDTAGGIMKRELLAIPEDGTVAQAVRALQGLAQQGEVEDIHNVLVVDREGRLVGIIPLGRLLLVDGATPIRKAMNLDPVRVETGVDQEEVASIFKKYNLVSLPVVNAGGRLVGSITVDDVVDVLEEESIEDMLLMSGVDEDDRIFCPPSQSVRKRLPWLYINLATALIAVSIVALFEDTISRMVTLAVFLPVVAMLGGNTGMQTLTLITRGIAMGEVGWNNIWRALANESLVALANGVAVGTVMEIGTYLWRGDWMLGCVIGLALIANMFVAGTVGTLTPVVLKRMRIDPAVASGIIVTTFTDAFGYFSFLGLATLALEYLGL